MSKLSFYAKLDCRTNHRQIRLLRDLGHEVEILDLLTQPWTQDALRGFFGRLPVSAWFNRNARAVSSGEIKPESFTEMDALALLTAEPLLIKRPLIESPMGRSAGFERHPVLESLGVRWQSNSEFDACSRLAEEPRCGE